MIVQWQSRLGVADVGPQCTGLDERAMTKPNRPKDSEKENVPMRLIWMRTDAVEYYIFFRLQNANKQFDILVSFLQFSNVENILYMSHNMAHIR